MDLPLVSIIIPVYNSSEYIENCLDSVIKQTYSNIEIILIDDGSDDNSLSILREYEKKDNRVHVTELSENRGQSAARNAGLEAAAGEWIVFVDSDDEAAPDMVESLLTAAQENKAQICAGSYIIRNMATGDECLKSVGSEVMPGRKAFDYLVCDKKFMIVCSCIFRKELFEGRRFPEGRIYEDSFMFAHVLLDSDICVCTDKVVYYYYQRGGGTALGSNIARRLDQIWVMHKIEEYTEKKAPECADKVYHFTFSVCGLLLERIYFAGAGKYSGYWAIVKEEFRKSAKKVRKKYFWERIEILLFDISPVLMFRVKGVYRAFMKLIAK